MINLIAVIFYILIIVYGSGENKIRSANLLFLYTFAGSLPMLLAILTIYSYVGSTDFSFISLSEISLDYQKKLFFCFFIAFAVKTPLWPFHLWLPRAHSDSPLAGSILLAGIFKIVLALNLAICWKHLIIRSISRALSYYLKMLNIKWSSETIR